VDGRLVAALHDGTHGVGLGTNGIRQQGHRRLRFWVPPSALRTDRDTTPSSAARRNVSSRHAVAARFTEKAAGPSALLPEAEDMAVVVAAASTESAPLSLTPPISTSASSTSCSSATDLLVSYFAMAACARGIYRRPHWGEKMENYWRCIFFLSPYLFRELANIKF